MFLGQLSKEKKEWVLDLSIHAALSNDDFVKEEKEIIDLYCVEMDLPKSDYNPRYSFDEVLEKLKSNCTCEELNMITIEIVALLISEVVYDDKEKIFMEKIQKVFDITDDTLEKIFDAIKLLNQSYAEMNAIIYE